MTLQERIKADAERMLKDQNEILLLNETYMEGYEEGYIAGATAENERAQGLVGALHDIASGKSFPKWIAQEALQQWKDGKEVENG